jgi:hypothetical protein
MPLPIMKTARRCHAKAKSTGQQCLSPAAFGCSTCRMHGARRRGSIKHGADHPLFVHGEATLEAKRETAESLRRLKRMEAKMKAIGLLKK